MKSQTQTQPYFSRKRVRRLIFIVGSLFALLCLIAWVIKRFADVNFDWSFLLPLLGLTSSIFPIGTAIVDWFEKRLSSIDERLDMVESAVKALEKKIEIMDNERYDLKGKIIRLEITYKAFINK